MHFHKLAENLETVDYGITNSDIYLSLYWSFLNAISFKLEKDSFTLKIYRLSKISTELKNYLPQSLQK